MDKVLIYEDEGVSRNGVRSLIASFEAERLHQKYALSTVTREVFREPDWHREVRLLIFPGGRDLPYHRALQGPANRQIVEFVAAGGSFLGICAGGYYGSASIEFERGNRMEVVEERELKFFPGLARGPVYGQGRFRYDGDEGACIAPLKITVPFLRGGDTVAYFNGGCTFVAAESHPSTSVLARYADLPGSPAAIVRCRVGAGCAVLCGVHPEYRLPSDSDAQRLMLFVDILNCLGIS